MRLMRGVSRYKIPNGISVNGVILKVGKIGYRLQQVSRIDDLPKVKKPEPYPAAYCIENAWQRDGMPQVLHIYPAPMKAWKMELLATQDVML